MTTPIFAVLQSSPYPDSDTRRNRAEPADEALATLAAEPDDAVLVDVFFNGTSGIDLCARIAERWENLPVVVMTA